MIGNVENRENRNQYLARKAKMFRTYRKLMRLGWRKRKKVLERAKRIRILRQERETALKLLKKCSALALALALGLSLAACADAPASARPTSTVSSSTSGTRLITDGAWRQVEVPETAGMTENSIFLTSSKEDVLIYASGNKIYRYYYSSYGNFPTTPDYTVGDSGEVIKTMLLDANEEKLYVATDSPSGEYRGNVYCYNYKTKELLWQEKGVAGTIVSMVYKTE